MSIRILALLNKPSIVLATGCAITIAFPFVPIGGLSLGLLKVFNVLAFATNVAAVSVPGRLDGEQQSKMRSGNLSPNTETSPLTSSESEKCEAHPMVQRERSLVLPAGWAFSIWGPIYLGEAVFCLAQFVDASNLSETLPQVTAPFVAANLIQSLWCASFRPSYNEGWHKYVSVAMLGGTAYSLSQLPGSLSWFFIPMVMHFGWTTAATLVNLNGSLAMEKKVPDYGIVAMGHASVVLATAIGVSVTTFELSTPVYALTVAWALAAVANGIQIQFHANHWSDSLLTGAKVQKALCWTGAILCLTASGIAMTFR